MILLSMADLHKPGILNNYARTVHKVWKHLGQPQKFQALTSVTAELDRRGGLGDSNPELLFRLIETGTKPTEDITVQSATILLVGRVADKMPRDQLAKVAQWTQSHSSPFIKKVGTAALEKAAIKQGLIGVLTPAS